jgi:hypothetical protein
MRGGPPLLARVGAVRATVDAVVVVSFVAVGLVVILAWLFDVVDEEEGRKPVLTACNMALGSEADGLYPAISRVRPSCLPAKKEHALRKLPDDGATQSLSRSKRCLCGNTAGILVRDPRAA